jgi:bacteriorhodopsin
MTTDINALVVTANILFLCFGIIFYSVKHYLFSIICFIAFANYSAINCQIGKMTSSEGVVDYIPRYLDWIITTPLLLLSLIHVTKIKDTKLIVFLLLCDILMIYTGYLGTLTDDPVFRLIMFFISVFFLFAIFSIVMKYSPPKWLTAYFFVVWLGYPIFWILHEVKLAITNNTYNYIISSLDIIAKIGFGLLLYYQGYKI